MPNAYGSRHEEANLPEGEKNEEPEISEQEKIRKVLKGLVFEVFEIFQLLCAFRYFSEIRKKNLPKSLKEYLNCFSACSQNAKIQVEATNWSMNRILISGLKKWIQHHQVVSFQSPKMIQSHKKTIKKFDRM